jgi:hypothetical protein
LTKAVRDVLLIFLDVVTAFGNYKGSDPRERSMGRKSNEMMMKVYAGKEAEWKRFDVQVSGLDSTISRFEKEIELIRQGKKWDTEAQKQAYRFCSSPKKNVPVWCPFPLLMPPLVKAILG